MSTLSNVIKVCGYPFIWGLVLLLYSLSIRLSKVIHCGLLAYSVGKASAKVAILWVLTSVGEGHMSKPLRKYEAGVFPSVSCEARSSVLVPGQLSDHSSPMDHCCLCPTL